MMKKLMLGAAALAITAAPMAASAADWGHGRGDWGRGYDRGYRDHDNAGPAIAAGIFGLMLGSALAHDHDGYYQSSCYWTTRPVYDDWGYVHYQRVEVCR